MADWQVTLYDFIWQMTLRSFGFPMKSYTILTMLSADVDYFYYAAVLYQWHCGYLEAVLSLEQKLDNFVFSKNF